MLFARAVSRLSFRGLGIYSPSMEKDIELQLSDMSAAELRKEVVKLRKFNQDLINIIKKTNAPDRAMESRPFDYSSTRKRHILLWISYLGWSFNGFVSQQNSGKTVEETVWDALSKVRLVEDIKAAKYSRCGRTDKGVSAFSQVISLDVRSIQPYDHSPLTTPELPYCRMLNRVLPSEIRAISWRPAAEDVNARFYCVRRTYKYFFPKANLNIEAMSEACTFIEGTHDFRNLCKMDVQNAVTKFVRTIDGARINHLEFQRDLENSAFDMYVLTVESSGFLYHQIRSIMHILFLVGNGLEKPEIIKELLDVEKNPQKPQYNLAHEMPLNLFQVEYPNDGFEWVFEENVTKKLLDDFMNDWTIRACKTAMMRSIIHEVHGLNPNIPLRLDSSFISNINGKHKPLMDRQKCDSLETMVKTMTNKRKIKTIENPDGETKIVKAPKVKIQISEADEETLNESASREELESLLINDSRSTLDNVVETMDTTSENGDNKSDEPKITRTEEIERMHKEIQ